LSIVRLDESNFQNYVIRARPFRRYVSGSLGIEGDVQLFSDVSPRMKEMDLPTGGGLTEVEIGDENLIPSEDPFIFDDDAHLDTQGLTADPDYVEPTATAKAHSQKSCLTTL
jgi:hypothetical protein